MFFLLSFALGLLAIAAYAAALAAVAWRLGSRRGSQGLLVAWLAGGLAFSLLMITKLHLQGTPFNLPPRTFVDRMAVFGSFGEGMLGTGFTTRSVRKRLRLSADGRMRRGDIQAGVGAFFAGLLVVLLIVAINDFSGMFRRLWR